MASDYYFLIPISVAIIITIVSVIIRKRTLASSKAAGGERTPPGPWKLPIIGNLHQLAIGSSLPHRRLAELAQQYGPLMQLQLGEIPTVIVSSAEWAKEFMQAHDLNFASRPFIPAANIIFYGGRDIGFSPHGPYWTKMRKIVAMELLGARRTKLLRPIMEQEMAKLVGLINTKPTINLTEAGSDTWTITVEWAMSELMKHPRVMEKAQREVRKVFNGKGVVDEASIDRLQYLQLVLKETLRLHPPGPLAIPRESKETIVVNGYKIPAKTRVFVNLWAINRDPHHWAQPEVFEPERFLNSSVDFRGTDFHYLPFGAGRRMCPGMHYGLALAYLSLANLIYHFDWKLPHQMKPEDLDMRERFGIEVKRQNNLIRA
ncbi:unnamed protein product [Linum tenue]|uniref:Cytochrome P450 n=1 Tax=Linum tenue TaxID=586396 RepID=A0AAV0NAA6_9ROSI|nr:unnamed protein product [Linum tenue]